jgi:cytoskeletal protein RodZ
VVALLRRREDRASALGDLEGMMTAKTLLMALGVGLVVGVLLGIGLVGLIGGNREQAAPTTAPPPRTVTVEETVETTVETTVEKTVPATTPDATPATATATAYP